MITDELLQQRIDYYSQQFDLYLDTGTLPPSSPNDNGIPDPLTEYLQEALSEPSNQLHCQEDPLWREVFKNSLLGFFEAMLHAFIPLEQYHQEEMDLRITFDASNLDSKREQWHGVSNLISKNYSLEEVNMPGYEKQLKASTPDQYDAIFTAMSEQWQKAGADKLVESERKVIRQRKQQFEIRCQEAGADDYQSILDFHRITVRYPQLKEIVDKMGRALPQDKELKDTTVTRYLPILLSNSPVKTEIDGVTMGDHIPDALPAELVYLSDQQTEDIFYHRFATHTLQLMESKPPSISQAKTEHTTHPTPRLIKGPIIVSVDTSYSMNGRPMDIAKALLMELLQMARRQHRSCFLITYSVHAQAIDLAHPANWRKVKDFLANGFTGGTNGNEMLRTACETLHTQTYSMADVLIISDFEWSQPDAFTRSKMDAEKLLGTRFYGLEINRSPRANQQPWLDQFWQLQP